MQNLLLLRLNASSRSYAPSSAYEVSLRIRLKVPYDPSIARSIHPKWFPRFPGEGNSAFDFTPKFALMADGNVMLPKMTKVITKLLLKLPAVIVAEGSIFWQCLIHKIKRTNRAQRTLPACKVLVPHGFGEGKEILTFLCFCSPKLKLRGNLPNSKSAAKERIGLLHD